MSKPLKQTIFSGIFLADVGIAMHVIRGKGHQSTVSTGNSAPLSGQHGHTGQSPAKSHREEQGTGALIL